MNTFFIRHKDDIHNLGRAINLFNEKRIGIFYDNLPWDQIYSSTIQGINLEFFENYTKPLNEQRKKEVKKYKEALGKIIKLSKEGGYVFAEYAKGHIGDDGRKGCILGVVKSETKVESFEGTNITIQLTEVVTIDYADFPVLLAVRPPYGTICEPKRTYKHIADFLYNKKKLSELILDFNTDFMHPKMVEQMCVEHLRLNGIEHKNQTLKLKYCFLRPGKSLELIDIAGRLDNNYILYAQVKNSVISEKDLAPFLSFTFKEESILAIFYKGPDKVDNKIQWVNLDRIFHNFLSKESTRLMISDLIGIKNIFS